MSVEVRDHALEHQRLRVLVRRPAPRPPGSTRSRPGRRDRAAAPRSGLSSRSPANSSGNSRRLRIRCGCWRGKLGAQIVAGEAHVRGRLGLRLAGIPAAAGEIQRAEQHRRHQRKQRDRDQQFDQREAARCGKRSCRIPRAQLHCAPGTSVRSRPLAPSNFTSTLIRYRRIASASRGLLEFAVQPLDRVGGDLAFPSGCARRPRRRARRSRATAAPRPPGRGATRRRSARGSIPPRPTALPSEPENSRNSAVATSARITKATRTSSSEKPAARDAV